MKNRNLPSSSIVETLTRRDLDILVLLAQDLTDREIADRLTLALSTVKWYARQVYAKLGVSQRSQVGQRAHDLGLLQPVPASNPKPARARNNLPAQLTSFIGREREIGELSLWIRGDTTRLLTITGTGGVGKTRLALRVAAELLDAFPDGVWWIELAPLADPKLIPQTMITALGFAEQPGRTSLTFLTDYLRNKELLLILDNCEHLVEACAELAIRLLRIAPRVKVLTTSREILGVSGEMSYRIPPLKMPDLTHLPPVAELTQFDAVRLFVDRAHFVDQSFEITEENGSTVAQITRRLDGIPLAIELAAARTRLLSVGQIALRLNDAFGLLTGGSRTDLPRHQTLQAMIDWSYHLLSEAERKLLRGLSVFAGGWTLEAAEKVSEQPKEVLHLLGQLADKSLLLVVSIPGGEKRFQMLETVRQYALARLIEANESTTMNNLHLGYYLHLGERLEPKLRSREQIHALDELERELDNIRLALDWGLQADIESELRLASALQWFWDIRQHPSEGIAWLEQGLETEEKEPGGFPPGPLRSRNRAKALTALGFLVLNQNDQSLNKATPILDEALALYRSCGSAFQDEITWALLWLGKSRIIAENSTEGRMQVEEALGLFRESHNAHGIAECLNILGDSETDTVLLKRIFLEILSIEQANGDIDGLARAHFILGVCANLDGDYEIASAEFAMSRENAWKVGNSGSAAFDDLVLAYASQCSGDLGRSTQYYEKALDGFREIVNSTQIVYCLFWKALNVFAQGDYRQVVELIAEARGWEQKIPEPHNFPELTYLQARLARIKGNPDNARKLAEEGLVSCQDKGAARMWFLLELGCLELQDGELARVDVLWRESMRILLPSNTQWMMFPLHAMAVLAAREGKLERAARLFGTRQAHGAAHFLSPIERQAREADLAALQAALGEEYFIQLQAEGNALNFNQVLALAQDEG